MTKLLNIALALSSLVFVSAARAEGDLVALRRAAAEHNPDYAATLAQGEADQQKRGQAAAHNSQPLMLHVAQAYFAVLAAEDSGAALTALEAATREAMEQARTRYEAGDAPVTDQSDARARFDLIAAQLVGARNELALRRSRLEDFTGKTAFRLARRRPP